MSSSSSPSSSPPPLRKLLPSQHRSPSPSLSSKHEPLLLPPPESRPTSPRKKSPPLPWTHQETLALIQAYQEKWYSLKKGQLKAFQWEEVAVTVAARCGFYEPSKTSTQCRHKIEKLRKRYRSELRKPYPINSWQYFELMDQMERGPVPLNARPIAVVKSFSNNGNGNINNSNNIVAHGYGDLYSSSADCYYNNDDYSRGAAGDSDDSDEKFNSGHGFEAVTVNRSRRSNNIRFGDVKNEVRNSKIVQKERGFRDSKCRTVGVPKNQVDGKQEQYYDRDYSDDDDDGNDHGDDDEESDGGMKLAVEIRSFAEKFIKMENKKIEMLRETERYRMEMEKKRMDMILKAQSEIVNTVDRAFEAHKKAKMSRETRRAERSSG